MQARGLRTALRVPQGLDLGARGAAATPKAPRQGGKGEKGGYVQQQQQLDWR